MTQRNAPQDMPPVDFSKVTFKNDLMFGRVLADDELCRGVLETILGEELGEIERIEREYTFDPLPQAHGVRADVFVQTGEQGRAYDLEMQGSKKKGLAHRMRYSHAAINVSLLLKGEDYDKLPGSCVIFICDFDPNGSGRAVSTYRTKCDEDGTELERGDVTILLNAKAHAKAKREDLRALLRYVSDNEATDELTRALDACVAKLRMSPEWRRDYMDLNYRFWLERTEGREEGLEQGLREGRDEERASFLARAADAVRAGGLALAEAASLFGFSEAEIAARL